MTTYIETNISAKKRTELIENFIPSRYRYKFQKGDLDAELLELKSAYANLPELIADLYLQHVLWDKGDEETFEPTLTAKEFVLQLTNMITTELNEWEQT